MSPRQARGHIDSRLFDILILVDFILRIKRQEFSRTHFNSGQKCPQKTKMKKGFWGKTDKKRDRKQKKIHKKTQTNKKLKKQDIFILINFML